MTAQTGFLSVQVLISWDGSGNYTGPYDDVSGYCRNVQTTRGRQKATDQFAMGQGSLVLNNITGRFSPFNPGSPIYPNVLPGRPIQITAAYLGVSYPVFTGFATPDMQTVSLRSANPEVTFTLADAFERLRLGLTNTPLQQAQRTDQLIGVVLDDIGWPAALRRLALGQSTLTFWTNHNRLPLNALQNIQLNEAGGAVCMGKDGFVVFEDRFFRGSQPVYATLSDAYELSLSLRQEDLVDKVTANYPRYALDSTLSNVFTISVAKPIPVGTTTFDFVCNAAGILGANGYVTPLVANTDYVANTVASGAGLDETSQVAITIIATNSNGGTMQVVNNYTAQVYLTMLNVRGFALRAGGEQLSAKVALPAPLLTGQTLTETFDFLDDPTGVGAWANFQSAIRGQVRVRPVINVTPVTDADMAMILGADISKRIAINDTGPSWLSQINGQYFIENIALNIATPGSGNPSVMASWALFDKDLALGSYFRVSSDVDESARGLAWVDGSIILSDLDAASRGLGVITSPADRVGV